MDDECVETTVLLTASASIITCRIMPEMRHLWGERNTPNCEGFQSFESFESPKRGVSRGVPLETSRGLSQVPLPFPLGTPAPPGGRGSGPMALAASRSITRRSSVETSFSCLTISAKLIITFTNSWMPSVRQKYPRGIYPEHPRLIDGQPHAPDGNPHRPQMQLVGGQELRIRNLQ